MSSTSLVVRGFKITGASGRSGLSVRRASRPRMTGATESRRASASSSEVVQTARNRWLALAAIKASALVTRSIVVS